MTSSEAIQSGDLEWVRQQPLSVLLDIQTNSDGERWSVTEEACIFNQLEILKYLLEDGPRHSEIQTPPDIRFALLMAAMKGHLNVLKYVFEDCPQREYFQNNFLGIHSFTVLVKSQQFEVLSYLIDVFPKRDVLVNDTFSLKILEESGSCGELEFIQYLLEDCSQKSKFSTVEVLQRALAAAIENGYLETVKYFIEKCPKREFLEVDYGFQSPIHWAETFGHVKTAAYLNSILEFSGKLESSEWKICQRVLFYELDQTSNSFEYLLDKISALPEIVLLQILSSTAPDRLLHEYLTTTIDHSQNLTSKLRM